MAIRLKMFIAIIAVATITGCAGLLVDRSAEEQAIRDLDKKWVGAIARGDVAAVADLYAADGAFMAPNAPAANGRKAIEAAWKGLMGLPALALEFGPTRIDIAASGDLATDIGTYTLGFDGKSGRVTDDGKYVVVWRKVDGRWRILADIFNSDRAAP